MASAGKSRNYKAHASVIHPRRVPILGDSGIVYIPRFLLQLLKIEEGIFFGIYV
jgi:hypothetical protein